MIFTLKHYYQNTQNDVYFTHRKAHRCIYLVEHTLNILKRIFLNHVLITCFILIIDDLHFKKLLSEYTK